MNTFMEKADTLNFISEWFIPITIFIGIMILVYFFSIRNLWSQIHGIKKRLEALEEKWYEDTFK